MINEIFGQWTVIAEATKRGKAFYFTCRCMCGKIQEVEKSKLKTGRSSRCKACVGRLRHGITIIPVVKSGDVFGKWTVIKEATVREDKRLRYLCKCDCGNECEVPSIDLRSGNRSTQCKECGAIDAGITAKTNYETSFSGREFGDFTVLNKIEETKNGQRWWNIKCQKCGLIAERSESALKELSSYRRCICNPPYRITKEPLYATWSGLFQRCYNPNNVGYSSYGSRGICVCERWSGETGFENFKKDMGSKPNSEMSIDRIDNDGNYEPNNCRWATAAQQARNTRTNHYIEIDGELRILSDWAKASEFKLQSINDRLKRGLSPKDAIFGESELHMCKVKPLNIDGVTKPLGEWAKISGIHRDTIGYRLEKGYDPKTAVFAPLAPKNQRYLKLLPIFESLSNLLSG